MHMNNTYLFKSGVYLLLIVCFPAWLRAGTGIWSSSATGGTITYITTESPIPQNDYSGNYLTIIYLENTGFKKIGQNTNAIDVNWLLSKGYRVIELNYDGNTNAVSPNINADIIAINRAINGGSFCGLTNCSKYRTWILFEGYRIDRDVSYFKDDPTVYNYSSLYSSGDSLHMDIIYPAHPSAPVPVVLSFSYSNSYFGDANINQRINLGYTFAGFNDSFLEGAPANGIAWAIADHPKYCPWGNGKPAGATSNKVYTSFETNPDAAQKVKSAVRTVRALGAQLGLSGKIGIYGFSRGSDAGSIAVGDRKVPEFENAGLHTNVSDDVQVAALGSGVFDFTYIYHTTGDGDSNLETNCPVAWGPLATNYAAWQLQGSYYLTQTAASAPIIFFYNTDDAQYYQNQIQHFKAHLDSLGIFTAVITNYGTGHSVPQTSGPLSQIYAFFNEYLTPPSVFTDLVPVSSENNDAKLTLNTTNEELSLSYQLSKAGTTEISLYNSMGKELSRIQRKECAGKQMIALNINKLHLTSGVYIVKLNAPGSQCVQKFIL